VHAASLPLFNGSQFIHDKLLGHSRERYAHPPSGDNCRVIEGYRATQIPRPLLAAEPIEGEKGLFRFTQL
jgi:hypothetical protein